MKIKNILIAGLLFAPLCNYGAERNVAAEAVEADLKSHGLSINGLLDAGYSYKDLLNSSRRALIVENIELARIQELATTIFAEEDAMMASKPLSARASSVAQPATWSASRAEAPRAEEAQSARQPVFSLGDSLLVPNYLSIQATGVDMSLVAPSQAVPAVAPQVPAASKTQSDEPSLPGAFLELQPTMTDEAEAEEMARLMTKTAGEAEESKRRQEAEEREFELAKTQSEITTLVEAEKALLKILVRSEKDQQKLQELREKLLIAKAKLMSLRPIEVDMEQSYIFE